jgi:hypothetical protein
VLGEQAIHGANRAVILAFIEQHRVHSGGRAVLEAFFVKTSQDRFSFCRFEGSGRRPAAGTPRLGQQPYGDANRKMLGASAELGKPRWCPRRWLVR